MFTVSCCDNFLQAFDVPLSSVPVGLSLLTNLHVLVVGVVSYAVVVVSVLRLLRAVVCLVWQKRNCDDALFDETHKVNKTLRKFEIVACFFVTAKMCLRLAK